MGKKKHKENRKAKAKSFASPPMDKMVKSPIKAK